MQKSTDTYRPNRHARRKLASIYNRRACIIYQGPSAIGGGDIVVIATWGSKNVKTGDMTQVWILPLSDDPLAAVQENRNSAVCGDCPLQGVGTGVGGKTINRVCYVNLGQAPLGIWRSFRRGTMPRYNPVVHAPILRSRPMRFGSYGDPAAIPDDILQLLLSFARLRGWSGYSHQLLSMHMSRERAEWLATFLMVSCHNRAQWMEAKRRGWRAFLVIPQDSDRPKDMVECPAYTHGVTCSNCRLCCGTERKAKSVYVIAHGKVGSNLSKVA